MMGVDEYLRTSFDGADCDFLDGEVVERNMGEPTHSLVQGEVFFLLRQRAAELGLSVRPEIRIQITPTRFRVADIGMWKTGRIGGNVATVPPFLVVEILSPDDRMVRVQPKIQEYLAIGVEFVWLIDPVERQALWYSRSMPAGVLTETLHTVEPAIEIALSSVLPA